MRGQEDRVDGKEEGGRVRPRPRPLSFTLLPLLLIFFLALGVRLLVLHDSRLEAARVQYAVADNYRHSARLLAEGGVAAFFSKSSPLADPDTLGHPPGYPLLLALVSRLSGEPDVKSSEGAARVAQLAADSCAAVLLFLLVAENRGIQSLGHRRDSLLRVRQVRPAGEHDRNVRRRSAEA